MVIGIWKYRKYILQNSWRDLRFRYAGSSMGFVWNVINPLFQILLFTLVFSKLMQVRIPGLPGGYGFAIYLCAGLIPWMSFAETVSGCTESLVASADYLKKLAIPEQVFVSGYALSVSFGLVISMTLFVAVCSLLGHYMTIKWIILPVILFLFQCFAFGIGFTLGVLNVFFRDIGQAVGLFIQLWFWATPIVYTENILPEIFIEFLICNPAYYYIDVLHKVIVNNNWPDCQDWINITALAVSMPLLGYLALRKLRYEIRDLL